MSSEEPFRRLLRWYPKLWRERNGDVLVGSMLDDADRQGRSLPTSEERRSAAFHGLGMRLDTRLAIGLALAALASAGTAGALSTWLTSALAAAGASWVIPLLTIAVSPALVMVGLVALARARGPVTEPRAVALVLLSVPAFAIGAVAFAAWGAAFDAADSGVPPTGLAATWPWLLGAAWLLGGAAVALFVEAFLRRIPLAIVVGAVLAPAIGVGSISPYVPAIAAVALAILAMWLRRPAPSVSPAVATARGPVLPRSRRLARALAAVGAVTSAAGIVHALLGGRWSALNDTAVMAQGITISLASALLLLAAIGLVAGRTAKTSGPIILAALSLGATAVAYTSAPDWSAMAPGFAAAAALGGLAVGWWSAARLPGSVRLRVVLGALIGLGYAGALGVMAAAMLAFAIPLLATAFAIWGARRAQPLALTG